MPEDIDELLLAESRQLSDQMAPFVPALCHNDLLPSNIIADDRRVWLVDWEYAGLGHPLFIDLAGSRPIAGSPSRSKRSCCRNICSFDERRFGNCDA